MVLKNDVLAIDLCCRKISEIIDETDVEKIKINETNHLMIKDGQADMTEAECPDQICVEHKSISKNKETIVCLPNKVIVEIVGGEDTELDAVAN